METLSTIGSWWVYLLVFAVIGGWLLWRRLPRLALFVAVTVGMSPLLNELVKLAVHRSRPVVADPIVHANGASFPSGHAQAAMVGYTVLLLVFLPVLRGWARPAAVGAAVLMVGPFCHDRVRGARAGREAAHRARTEPRLRPPGYRPCRAAMWCSRTSRCQSGESRTQILARDG